MKFQLEVMNSWIGFDGGMVKKKLRYFIKFSFQHPDPPIFIETMYM